MAQAVDREVTTASPNTSLLDTLVETGLVVNQVSRLGMEPALVGGLKLRHGTYFLGCCGHDVSPLETLTGHFLQLRLFQLQRIDSVCVIARDLAEKSCSHSHLANIQQRAKEHLAIAKRFVSVTGAPMEVIFDDQLVGTTTWRLVESELSRHELKFLWQKELEYFLRQHQLLEVVRRLFNVQLKSGWTVVSSAEKFQSLVRSWVAGQRPSACCEAAFDTLTIAIHRLAQECGQAMCYLYSPPAFTFCAKHPVAVPYASRVSLHGDAQRILLRKGQDLARLIPQLHECSTRTAITRTLKAMENLDRLVCMIDQALPSLFDRPREQTLYELERCISDGQRVWQEAVDAHGPQSREVHHQAGLVRKLRIEHATLVREQLIPKLRRVIDIFGI
jgi:hypothetical protein